MSGAYVKGLAKMFVARYEMISTATYVETSQLIGPCSACSLQPGSERYFRQNIPKVFIVHGSSADVTYQAYSSDDCTAYWLSATE